jgi:predicted RNA-binding protein
MCEAVVYVERGGQEELLLEDVCLIRPDEEAGGLLVRSIFGEQKIIDAYVCRADLAGHRIVLKEKS